MVKFQTTHCKDNLTDRSNFFKKFLSGAAIFFFRFKTFNFKNIGFLDYRYIFVGVGDTDDKGTHSTELKVSCYVISC